MNARISAALAVAVAASGLTATADAAPPKKPAPVCNLVTDDKNDTFAFRSQDSALPAVGSPTRGTPYDAAFDITSADVASDGKVVTAAIRVVKLGAAQTSPQGRGFAFDFVLPTSELVASMRAVLVNGQEPYFEATYKDTTYPNTPSTFLAKITGTIDEKKNEIRIHAPVDVFAELGGITKTTLITPAPDAATSGRAVPPSPGIAGQPVATRYVFADVATVSKPYRVGTTSCVTPGK